MCGFDGVQRGNCIGEELIKGTEVEVRVKKVKNRKTFTSGVVPED